MSSDTGQFTNGEIAMAFVTAFIIGFGMAFTVAIVASKTINAEGAVAALIAGLVTAAKDYRSLKRMPAISNGTQPPFPPEKTP